VNAHSRAAAVALSGVFVNAYACSCMCGDGVMRVHAVVWRRWGAFWAFWSRSGPYAPAQQLL
jgi:hypothetical protein